MTGDVIICCGHTSSETMDVDFDGYFRLQCSIEFSFIFYLFERDFG